MRGTTRRVWTGVALAVLASIVVVAIRLSLFDSPLGDRAQLLLFMLPTMLAAWAGGLGAGLLATALGGLAAMYFMAPFRSLEVHWIGDRVELAGYVLVGVLVSSLYEQLHRSRQRVENDEARMRRSDEFHGAIADLTSDFAFEAWLGADGELRIESVSEGFEKLLGYPLGELAARGGWRALIAPNHPAQAELALDALRAGQIVDDEVRIAARDGRLVWLHYRIQPVSTARAGAPLRIFGAAQDVTERRRAEEALRQADRRKDEFLATLAHELRNPLAPIRNALEVMRIAPNDEHSTEDARRIMERQLGQLVRLIDELLDLSRIASGKVELRRERIALEDTIKDALETARPVIESRGHELSVTMPPGPVVLDADRSRLAQVFANLLHNAAKYTEPGGRIWLTAEREGSDAVITVRDTGVGIPAEMLPRVFDLFSQADSSLDRAQGGLGIGLNLVRRLIAMHGGSVEARSEGPGCGSTFIVRLPMRVQHLPMPSHEPRAANPGSPPGGPYRVLVVDDNEDAVESLAILLRMMGHDVRVARDGLAAVDEAARYDPDVILLDIGLPRLNGYDAARRIRARPGGSRVLLVAVTGWGQEGDRRRSRESGFDEHLVKPVDAATLESVLRRVQGTAGRGA